MSRTERRKGLGGELEVRALYERHGLIVRGLEGGGDHLVVVPAMPESPWSHPGARRPLTIHSEVKRCETARPWAWWEQASAEAPPGALAIVAFRRSRSPWLALADLDALAAALTR